MDQMTAFERQLSVELGQMAGPGRRIDGMAMVSAISTQSPEWRFQTMFSATKFSIAGAIVALFGVLVVGMPSQPRAGDGAPAASTSEPPSLVYMLDGDIYVAEEDGTDPVRIIEGDADAECGDIVVNRGLVSPDGRHIAYRSGCPGTVVIADLDGQVVASVPGDGWDIAWSADGTRFATWLSLWETIGVYGIDGSLQAELDGSSTCCGDHDPRWTHDGSALLLPARDSDRATALRLPIDGGAPQVIPADDPGSHRSLSYSPDGRHAAFVLPGPWPDDRPAGSAADPARAQLVIIATDGNEPARVIEFEPGEQVDAGWGRGPLWSRRGDRIAVVVDRSSGGADGDPKQEPAHLRIIDPLTGLAIVAAVVEDGGSLQPIAFSADGERILVQRSDADGVSDLSSVNVDGSGSTIIVPSADHGEWVPPSRSDDVPIRP